MAVTLFVLALAEEAGKTERCGKKKKDTYEWSNCMAITIGMVASNQQLHLRNQTVKETLHQRQWVRDISGALTTHRPSDS